MEIRTVSEKSENVIIIDGRLDTANAPILEKALQPFIQESKNMVLDCEKMPYISSSGLRIFLATHNQLTAKGQKLSLRHVNKEVLSVIHLTGFSHFLTIEE